MLAARRERTVRGRSRCDLDSGTAYEVAQVGDPDKAQAGPVLPGKRLPVRICELPVEEQGLTHDRVVSERIRLPEAVRLQLAVGMHVLAYALRGLQLL